MKHLFQKHILSWRRNIGVICLLGLAIGLMCVFTENTRSNSRRTLKVFLAERPTSLDPLDFDFTKHIPIQSAVNIKLFSNYKDSTLTGQLAESWIIQKSGAEWRIKIRNDVNFSNGERLTLDDAVGALQRIFFLMKKMKSKNELLLSLADLENLNSANDEHFRGIRREGNELVFSFKRPVQKLMDVLSFGLYSIVARKSYDRKTGKWISKIDESYLSSGPYKIRQTSNSELLLEIKENYPGSLFHEHAFKFISLFFDRAKLSTADLVSGPIDMTGLSSDSSFHSAGSPHIMYVACHSWKLRESLCSSRRKRVEIRNAFESELSKRKISSSRSFFPTTMPGVSEPIRDDTESNKFELSSKLTFFDYRVETKSPRTHSVLDSLEAAIISLGIQPVPVHGASYESLSQEQDPNLSKYTADLVLFSTDIAPYDPEGDIRLMFSKEGIELPDVSGEIQREISKDNFSIQKINEYLYSQAVIWPAGHYQYGVWSRNSLDLSKYGFLLPLGELQWIGY